MWDVFLLYTRLGYTLIPVHSSFRLIPHSETDTWKTDSWDLLGTLCYILYTCDTLLPKPITLNPLFSKRNLQTGHSVWPKLNTFRHNIKPKVLVDVLQMFCRVAINYNQYLCSFFTDCYKPMIKILLPKPPKINRDFIPERVGK